MKNWLIIVLVAAGLTACASQPTGSVPDSKTTASAKSADSRVQEKILANGLKVIVKEDHRAPVLVSQVWYKVGSGYEHDGITGVSHVLEHMMFKGTKKFKPGEFSRIIAENGGQENAFTGRDYTAYFQQLEKSRLKVSFEMEADRMRNLVLLGEEFDKEIKVVMEERRMRTEDNPQAITYEQFSANAYLNSGYHWPVIGWMNDLENMQLEDLAQWYKYWYAPNNAVVVVVGDVNAKEVFDLAEKYFGGFDRGEIPKRKPRIEVEQIGERRIVVKAPAQVPYLIMGYKVPSLVNAKESWEPYALEVLAAILDGGNSARFAKDLIRGSQIAQNVGAGYDSITPQQEVFQFSGTPSSGKTVDDLEKAIKDQIAKLRKEKVSKSELSRVKAQVVAGKVYEQDSVFYQAMIIGMLETMGYPWSMADEYVDRINAVTSEQVQAVAKKYFQDESLTVAVLDPQPLDSNKMRPRNLGGSRAH
ncbi:MAG: insulinase family protein [Gammaproteobacteria bacterium]|nr:insulinase family protein [Gammaproteobacteria bacterium]